MTKDAEALLKLAERLLDDSAQYFETLFERHSIKPINRGIDPEKLKACANALRQAAPQGRGERAAVQSDEALAWHCCDERYPWIKGIVTTSPITLDAWRDSGIEHQPLYPRTSNAAQTSAVRSDEPVRWLVTWPDGEVTCWRERPHHIKGTTVTPLYAFPQGK